MAAIRSDQIKLALSKRHTDDLFLTEVKTGRTWDNKELLKFDALAMKRSWANPCLTGYEVKVSRSDFIKDQKWPGYMAYCNKFSFVCPKGLIQKDELPEEVGLIYYYPDTGAMRAERSAKHRFIDIPAEMYVYLLMSRIEPDRHPFFSSRREMFEAYLEEKKTCKSLGRLVGSKLVDEVNEIRKQYDDQQWEIKRMKDQSELLQKVRIILEEHGIRLSSWNDWESELRQLLKGGINPQMVMALNRITDNAEVLKKMLEPKEDIRS
ncbi:MmcB family DNA repair protein [Paenibacillus azoreducens]|uniref:MmcB family DNA repair protein n=1 Tax=Paenibacillus azoreducens TaxID=116718 RepID=UPI0039F4F18A